MRKHQLASVTSCVVSVWIQFSLAAYMTPDWYNVYHSVKYTYTYSTHSFLQPVAKIVTYCRVLILRSCTINAMYCTSV